MFSTIKKSVFSTVAGLSHSFLRIVYDFIQRILCISQSAVCLEITYLVPVYSFVKYELSTDFLFFSLYITNIHSFSESMDYKQFQHIKKLSFV